MHECFIFHCGRDSFISHRFGGRRVSLNEYKTICTFYYFSLNEYKTLLIIISHLMNIKLYFLLFLQLGEPF